MPTQLERAQELIRTSFEMTSVIEGTADQGPAFKELKEILDRNQNTGPGSPADGSFDEKTWTALMEALRAIRDISMAFRRVTECFDTVLSAGSRQRIAGAVRVVKRNTKFSIPKRSR